MNPEAIMEMIWPGLCGLVVMPAVQWLKSKVPADIPFLSTVLAIGLSALLVWGVDWFYELGLTKIQMTAYVMGSNVVAQFTHSVVKTKKKTTLS